MPIDLRVECRLPQLSHAAPLLWNAVSNIQQLKALLLTSRTARMCNRVALLVFTAVQLLIIQLINTLIQHLPPLLRLGFSILLFSWLAALLTFATLLSLELIFLLLSLRKSESARIWPSIQAAEARVARGLGEYFQRFQPARDVEEEAVWSGPGPPVRGSSEFLRQSGLLAEEPEVLRGTEGLAQGPLGDTIPQLSPRTSRLPPSRPGDGPVTLHMSLAIPEPDEVRQTSGLTAHQISRRATKKSLWGSLKAALERGSRKRRESSQLGEGVSAHVSYGSPDYAENTFSQRTPPLRESLRESLPEAHNQGRRGSTNSMSSAWEPSDTPEIDYGE